MISKTGFILLALFFCSFSFSKEISITKAYARETEPNSSLSAAFMHINNHSKREVRLISAHSQQARTTEIHTHLHTSDDAVKMRAIKFVEIPAKDTSILAPDGVHLVLQGVKRPLQEGDKIDVELLFSNGERINTQIPVTKIHSSKN